MAVGSPTYKVILCGEYGVGKSSIFRRFSGSGFTPRCDKTSTIGLDSSTRIYDMGTHDVKILLWDTGGMERMSFVGSSYYRGAQAALLCYSLARRDTFNLLSQYILDIVMNAEGAKIFLCGNMADSDGDGEVVNEDELENFVHDCGDVLSGVYRISCKDNSGIDEMFFDIACVMDREFENRMTLKRGFVLGDKFTVNHKTRCC